MEKNRSSVLQPQNEIAKLKKKIL